MTVPPYFMFMLQVPNGKEAFCLYPLCRSMQPRHVSIRIEVNRHRTLLLVGRVHMDLLLPAKRTSLFTTNRKSNVMCFLLDTTKLRTLTMAQIVRGRSLRVSKV